MINRATVTALRFCAALGFEGDASTSEWQDISLIAKRARIRDPNILDKVIAFALTQGWIERGEESSVRLTDAGRKLRES